MNVIRAVALASLALVGLAITGNDARAQGQPIVIRYAGTLPVTHHISQGGELFAKLVNEKSKGALKVEHYPAGQLYKAHDIVGAVVSGALDMGDNLTVVWSKAAVAEIADIPFLFRDHAHAKKAWDRGGPLFKAYAADIAKKNMITLHMMNFGSLFDLSNNKHQLREPKDFKGMKVRSYGAMAAEALRALGASPVVIDPGEMYLALQRGTIDGLISGVTSIDNRKLWEVGKFATITGATSGIMGVNMNVAKYNSLPDALKRVLQEAGDEAQAWTMDEAIRQDQKSLDFIKSKGVQVHIMTPQEKDVMVAAVAVVSENWNKRATDEERKAVEWVRSLR